MANINIENISDLNLNGNDLFEDSESFIAELSDDNEQANIIGGTGPCQQISDVIIGGTGPCQQISDFACGKVTINF